MRQKESGCEACKLLEMIRSDFYNKNLFFFNFNKATQTFIPQFISCYLYLNDTIISSLTIMQ